MPDPVRAVGAKLLVEVWSDVMCPFCVLGKHRFAQALARFPYHDDVEVVWKSFQLDPTLRADSPMTINEYLASRKGIDPRQAAAMNDRLTRAGAQEGIVYHFDRAIVANTFDAHRLLHLARDLGKQNEAAERLFAAYFSEGLDVADHSVLAQIGRDVGLDSALVTATLASDRCADAVRADIAEARELGIDGVPFFVLDRKFAVSGAQDAALFLQALEQAKQGLDLA